jgi:hypothetical protein
MRGRDLAQRVDQSGPTVLALDSLTHRGAGGIELLVSEGLRPSSVKGILKVGVHVLYLPLHGFDCESMREKHL